MKDMSKQQFNAACARYGFKSEGFMGYYKLPAPYDNSAVSIYNAGSNRRAQLAYLLAELDRHEKQLSPAITQAINK